MAEPWTPLKAGERDDIALVKYHTLALENEPLKDVMTIAGTGADSAFGVDDAMPWNAGVAGQGIQSVADKTRVTGNAGETSDLTVSSDASARNPGNGSVDLSVSHEPLRFACRSPIQ
jgi:hypothetical protein